MRRASGGSTQFASARGDDGAEFSRAALREKVEQFAPERGLRRVLHLDGIPLPAIPVTAQGGIVIIVIPTGCAVELVAFARIIGLIAHVTRDPSASRPGADRAWSGALRHDHAWLYAFAPLSAVPVE